MNRPRRSTATYTTETDIKPSPRSLAGIKRARRAVRESNASPEVEVEDVKPKLEPSPSPPRHSKLQASRAGLLDLPDELLKLVLEQNVLTRADDGRAGRVCQRLRPIALELCWNRIELAYCQFAEIPYIGRWWHNPVAETDFERQLVKTVAIMMRYYHEFYPRFDQLERLGLYDRCYDKLNPPTSYDELDEGQEYKLQDGWLNLLYWDNFDIGNGEAQLDFSDRCLTLDNNFINVWPALEHLELHVFVRVPDDFNERKGSLFEFPTGVTIHAFARKTPNEDEAALWAEWAVENEVRMMLHEGIWFPSDEVGARRSP
ncbi:hypothetical protein JCM10908_004422 [Rhodotorula pacifica]|uniref:uncharacterized protein n=1 Tax=Rhodotorula pacifica TaxID=1495444 RepID=UPI00317E0D11